jgi:hypothetical protein
LDTGMSGDNNFPNTEDVFLPVFLTVSGTVDIPVSKITTELSTIISNEESHSDCLRLALL